MAESLDFQINDLKFRAAISDKFPYARATAPFRKEQFDSAPTVGDQSLAGWWTRGQLSFHKGAGVKYYEVLEGEDILNTFHASVGLDIQTPGRVSPHRDLVAYSTADLKQAASASYGSAYNIAGVENWTNAAVAINTAGVKTTLATATAGANVWHVGNANMVAFFATDNGVEKMPSGGTTLSLAWGRIATDIFGFPQGVWGAKGRLFTVTASGKWFQKAVDSTGTLADADAFWIAGLDSLNAPLGYKWSLADSPGPVYVSFGPEVYSVTVDQDGSVPVLSAAVTAMTLPNDEYVVDMKYGLGQLVIVTSKGVRIATDGGGGLVYGPLLFKHAPGSAGSHVQIQGSTAYVASSLEEEGVEGYAITSIDLTQPTGDLLFAWTVDHTHTGTIGLGGVRTGRYVLRNDGIFKADPLTATDPLVSSGWLQTGFHRLGTLDAKHFQSVSVRCGGTGGSISVYRVDADDTETLLGSITPAESAKEFDIGLTVPVERIALKFVLTRDSADSTLGPEFLGYQLKALPSPKRQRLIQWPVVATDAVRDRYGVERGRRGSAWEAWEALESLEENDALVTYTDHRTGETGEAFIENIELQSDTPSQGATSGFGGVGMITLRKVS